MTAENSTAVSEKLRSISPCRVFTVELHGGERFEVDFPAAQLVSRDGVAVFLGPGGVPFWFDHDSVLRFIGATSDSEA